MKCQATNIYFILKGDSEGSLLKTFLKDIEQALRSQEVHEANITMLSNITESLAEQLDVSHPVRSSVE